MHGIAWDFAKSLTYGQEHYLIYAPSDVSYTLDYDEYYIIYTGDIADDNTVVNGVATTVYRSTGKPYFTYTIKNVQNIKPSYLYSDRGFRAYQSLESECVALTPQIQVKYSAVALSAVFLSAVIFAITFSSIRILRR